MGYWKATRDGVSLQVEGDFVWGDHPADLMDDTIQSIVEAFEKDVGRRPTHGELRAGLEFSIGGGDDDETYAPWSERA